MVIADAARLPIGGGSGDGSGTVDEGVDVVVGQVGGLEAAGVPPSARSSPTPRSSGAMCWAA